MGQRRARADREGSAEVTPPVHVKVVWKGEERFDTGREGRQSIRIDGDGITGPSPVDALLCALGTCVSVDVVAILAKRRTPVESYSLEAVGERVEMVPRRFSRITLNVQIVGASVERVHAERAIELAVTKYCSVGASLREDIPVGWTLSLNGEPAPAA